MLLGRYHDHAKPQLLRERQNFLSYGGLGGVVGDMHEVHQAAAHDTREVPEGSPRVVRSPDCIHPALVSQAIEGVEPPLDGDEVVDLVELDAAAEVA